MTTMAGTVLVTGGAGYVGSHVVLALLDAGHQVVVLDDLSTGVRELVPASAVFIEGDIADAELVRGLIAERDVSAVMHFAASVVVPESVADPLKYYRNNTSASRNLIEACAAQGIARFIFSSTAAVYGIPERVPVTETAACQPINPYGSSKLMTELMLRDVAAAGDFPYVCLRYFNVAGTDPEGRSGETAPEATHLITIACQAATGAREHIEIFGEDYDTPDGTCIRDYVHVTDLGAAHLAALDYLMAGGESLTLNCGYGRGYSVLEVLRAVEKAAGLALNKRPAPRRAGDPPVLIADANRIRERLGWRPKFDDLNVIVETALAWQERRRG